MEALGLPNNLRGVVVTRVIEDSPAEAAGLRPWETESDSVDDAGTITPGRIINADIILSIDGEPLTGIASLITYLARQTRPGDVVDLTVLRDGEQIIIPLTLGRREPAQTIPLPTIPVPGSGPEGE
jgi:S1-C subfamily serine protease